MHKSEKENSEKYKSMKFEYSKVKTYLCIRYVSNNNTP